MHAVALGGVGGIGTVRWEVVRGRGAARLRGVPHEERALAEDMEAKAEHHLPRGGALTRTPSHTMAYTIVWRRTTPRKPISVLVGTSLVCRRTTPRKPISASPGPGSLPSLRLVR